MENQINVYCDSWLHNNTCLEFEKFERCVIEATEIMTREDVKQQVEEFSFYYHQLVLILLAAERAVIG